MAEGIPISNAKAADGHCCCQETGMCQWTLYACGTTGCGGCYTSTVPGWVVVPDTDTDDTPTAIDSPTGCA